MRTCDILFIFSLSVVVISFQVPRKFVNLVGSLFHSEFATASSPSTDTYFSPQLRTTY